jgi:hypothetical protein
MPGELCGELCGDPLPEASSTMVLLYQASSRLSSEQAPAKDASMSAEAVDPDLQIVIRNTADITRQRPL